MPEGDRQGEYFKHEGFQQDVDRAPTLRATLTLRRRQGTCKRG
jgi:hypothetical protein